MSGKTLRIENLYKTYVVEQKEIPILNDINLEIREGELVTIVGQSGCGKSTLLRIIAGLTDYDKGSVTYGGEEIYGTDKKRGMVFQDHRLFPWMKIKDNVGLGLKGHTRQEKEEIVEKHLKLVKLEGFENAYPSQLSGGMAQRAAIARGLATRPEILLLDEPFGALDALTRIQMQKEVLRIWKSEKISMILVTHDIDEAIYLGQRIIVMSARPGEIKEVIEVSSAGAKDRGSMEFSNIKKKIYQYFFEDDKEIEAEYYI